MVMSQVKILAKPILAKLRQDQHLSLEQASQKLRISYVTLWRIEQRKSGADIKLARSLCSFYDAPFFKLFEIIENKE